MTSAQTDPRVAQRRGRLAGVVTAAMLALVASVATAAGGGASPPPGPDNPWLRRRVVGLAHAGGEDENPHSTLYAFGQATKDGATMLDMDLQITSDGVPVVIHNDTVDRTTNGTGTVSDMTFAQVHALDAAYWFTADCWACSGRPAGDYLYRGIRTGAKPPPPGYTADDFGVPSLEEVFQRFPHAYFDIEIKDDGAQVPELAQKTADLIHEYGMSEHVVIASFGQPGMDVFRAAAPDVATSATLDEVQAFFLHGTVPAKAQVLDVPPFYDLSGTTITIVSPAFVDKAHKAGLAVWVWMDSVDEQNADFYGKLLDMGVDGLNASRPSVMMDLLRARGVAWDPNAPDVGPTTSLPTTSAPSVPPATQAPPAAAVGAYPTYTG
jgi:glycerophosphoryl diester phosphodiesterase